jgi:hypothetical protein
MPAQISAFFNFIMVWDASGLLPKADQRGLFLFFLLFFFLIFLPLELL